MTPLPENVSDSEIIAFVDRWAALLEREDYEAAFGLTGHHPSGAWTAQAILEAIKRHGARVTLDGVWDGNGHHDKEVTRWPTKPDGYCGDIWYDLYVDGRHSDLTALFYLKPTEGGLVVHLIDIGVK